MLFDLRDMWIAGNIFIRLCTTNDSPLQEAIYLSLWCLVSAYQPYTLKCTCRDDSNTGVLQYKFLQSIELARVNTFHGRLVLMNLCSTDKLASWKSDTETGQEPYTLECTCRHDCNTWVLQYLLLQSSEVARVNVLHGCWVLMNLCSTDKLASMLSCLRDMWIAGNIFIRSCTTNDFPFNKVIYFSIWCLVSAYQPYTLECTCRHDSNTGVIQYLFLQNNEVARVNVLHGCWVLMNLCSTDKLAFWNLIERPVRSHTP